jgi:transcription-repair coupling factor (superfamily II helicase)
MFSDFFLPLPHGAGAVQRCQTLPGAATSLIASQIIQQHPGLVLLVVADCAAARRLQLELPHFTPQPVILFPDWETLPYDSFSPDADRISDRLKTLYQLPQLNQGALIIPLHTLMQRLIPRQFLIQKALCLALDQPLSREVLREQLLQAGYQRVDQVLHHGEFAVRGSLIDLFPMGCHQPYRLDFFGADLESIRTFDLDSQRSHSKSIHQLQLLPAHEFGTDANSIECFRRQWRERFAVLREPEQIYQQVSRAIFPPGIEYWQPLFFEDPLPTLFAYLPASTLCVTLGEDLEPSAQHFRQSIEQRFASHYRDPLRPLLPPDELWCRVDQLFTEFKNYPRMHLQLPALNAMTASALPLKPLPDLQLSSHPKNPLSALRHFAEHFPGTVLFSVDSAGRREVLSELLQPLNLRPQPIQHLSEAQGRGPFTIITPCQQGVMLGEQWALITEADLLGKRVHQPPPSSRKKTPSFDTWVRHLAELTPGQAVVHLQHGIGRYCGLTTLETRGIAAEYLILQYADEATLYVPVTSLQVISRYSGGSDTSAPLHKLGSDQWTQARQKALEKARDVAAELLEIYAQRAAKPGFAYQLDPAEYQRFCQSFPFDETPDQATAIQAVLQDMQQPSPMDRLVCGDVGFGKTEVALRAAFVAISNHKQVLLLVPTTLLAEQHAEICRDRFAYWPIRIEVLSRFRTAKAQQQVLSQLATGAIDMVIGTHKLLHSSLTPKNLGLLIIDEEHRFGVQQKEQIKALRAQVDLLSLTATPIPRTLNMALQGLRDLSIIATAPTRRLAVKTFVREYDAALVREALQREILRDGQIYYLHNEVKTIEQAAAQLQQLLPEARIGIGHGQLGERALERLMSDFYHRRFNVLVCSTIIETGIDIPTANTMIINRADRFGLAQLHQLRGRVGRSHHQAYAYLLTPPLKQLPADARQRLEAIESLGELGAGFALASHDLDIRGAGELLGAEQSGQMSAVGFTLYQELLEQAIQALKKGQEPSLSQLTSQQTEIELRLSALLPESYIANVNLRLSFYKRLASAKDQRAVQALRSELVDRFGPLPVPADQLLQVTHLRQLAQPLGLKRIEGHASGGSLIFQENTSLDPQVLITLLQQEPHTFRLNGPTRLQFTKPLPEPAERLQFVQQLLEKLNQ